MKILVLSTFYNEIWLIERLLEDLEKLKIERRHCYLPSGSNVSTVTFARDGGYDVVLLRYPYGEYSSRETISDLIKHLKAEGIKVALMSTPNWEKESYGEVCRVGYPCELDAFKEQLDCI